MNYRSAAPHAILAIIGLVLIVLAGRLLSLGIDAADAGVSAPSLPLTIAMLAAGATALSIGLIRAIITLRKDR